MADSGNQNQTENFPSAPPPPQEVKIRTMKSDLASLAQTGGGLPQFQSVRIDLPRERSEKLDARGEKKINAGIAVVIVAIVVVLAVAAYFALVYLKK
ncbi:MAG: hypothetical protein KGJ13_00755 [Patescibacteria group bacterium]|nr:hypothetical protein [Patescibacteria group bacterium]